MDPTNAEFVVFVKVATTAAPVSPIMLSGQQAPTGWIPLSIVKGGQAANLLVKARAGRAAQPRGSGGAAGECFVVVAPSSF